MNQYFIIIPEGNNFGYVYVLRDNGFFNVSAFGTEKKVDIILGGKSQKALNK